VVIAVRVVAGVLLLAHGWVHLLYLAPDVPEFSIGRSWLLPAPARRPVARVLMAATVAAFTLAALAVWACRGSPASGRPSPSGPACCRWPCSPHSGTPCW